MKHFLILALLGLSLSTVCSAASCPKGRVTSHKYINSSGYRIYFCLSDDALNPPYSLLLKTIFDKTDFVEKSLFSLGNASASISLADAFNGAVITKNNQVYKHNKDNPQAYLPTGAFGNATWNQPIIYNFYSRLSSQQMVNYLRQHASIFKANAGAGIGNESEGESLARYDYDIAIIKDAKFLHIKDNTKFLLGDIKFYWSQRFGNTHWGYLHHAAPEGGTVNYLRHLGVLTEIELKIGDGYEIKKPGDYAVSITVDTVN